MQFKVEVYFNVFYTSINSFEELSKQMYNHCVNFKFLYDKNNFKNMTKNIIQKKKNLKTSIIQNRLSNVVMLV